MTRTSMMKEIYRTLVPLRIRGSKQVARLKSLVLGHDAVYSEEFFQRDVERAASESAPVMADTLMAEFRPRSVIDVGCGTGALLAALRERGCAVAGLEYADAGIRYCKQRGLDVEKFDLESDAYRGSVRHDLVVSVEVAEHLPARTADRYVDLLTQLGPVVAMTAAGPGQEGTDHVNLQPPSYWIEKFLRRNFGHDGDATKRLAGQWTSSGSVQAWYCSNLLVFRRRA